MFKPGEAAEPKRRELRRCRVVSTCCDTGCFESFAFAHVLCIYVNVEINQILFQR